MEKLKTDYRILITPTSIKPDSNSAAIAALRNFAGELVYNTTGKPLAARELVELLKGCDGVIAGLDDFSDEVISAVCSNNNGGVNASEPEDDSLTEDESFTEGESLTVDESLTEEESLTEKEEDKASASGAPLAADGRLKVISRYGSGYDNVDLTSARANGVAVCYAPGANAEAVADLALGLMLCLARLLPMLDRKTKAGEWVRSIGI